VERGEDAVIPALSRLIAVKPLTPALWPGVAHMFIGPSGVGKTTILLRLALDAKRRAKDGPVTVVNADAGRGKGRLMLRHYAELSGLNYAEADGPEAFGRFLDGAAKGEAVFIDTPSLTHGGGPEAWMAQWGLVGRRQLAAHLVLSPTYSSAQSEHYLRLARCEPLSSIIWTKLDEACNYGSLVNMAHASGLPVSALTYGPELTGGMAAASGKALWKLLFKRQLPGQYPDADAAACRPRPGTAPCPVRDLGQGRRRQDQPVRQSGLLPVQDGPQSGAARRRPGSGQRGHPPGAGPQDEPVPSLS
jgi:flagellar biosynthesis protein FlhF